MPQGRGSKRKAKAKPDGRGDVEAPETPVDGILVRLIPGEQEGTQQITVSTLGTTKLTEAPSILRIAAKNAENQLGID